MTDIVERKLTTETIKEFFAELREDGYDQYMRYPLEEIERAVLRDISQERVMKMMKRYHEAFVDPSSEDD